MGYKRKKREENDYEYDPAPKHLQVGHIKNQEKRLIVILENAQLESVKVGNSFELLNCDDHINILKKNNRDPGTCRPDIVHQCLLMLMDSPLNRAGLLQVYVHTEKNVLIEINPQTRIPRTFKRFAGLMGKWTINACLCHIGCGQSDAEDALKRLIDQSVQLLHKYGVRASDGPMKLLKVIKNPISDHLPVGCHKILMSFSANKVLHPREFVPPEDPIAIVVGAMAHGQVRTDYTEDTISISNYPLSGAVTCSKLCTAFEEVWGIV